MQEEVNAEEEFSTQTTIFKDSVHNISTMINDTLVEKIEPISFNSTIQEVDEDNYQVIQDSHDCQPSLSVMINNGTLGKSEPYNENMIFEETDKKVLTTKVPFILPVPFP